MFSKSIHSTSKHGLRSCMSPRHRLTVRDTQVTNLSRSIELHNSPRPCLQYRGVRTRARRTQNSAATIRKVFATIATLATVGGVSIVLYRNDFIQTLPPTQSRAQLRAQRKGYHLGATRGEGNINEVEDKPPPPSYSEEEDEDDDDEDETAWSVFTSRFETVKSVANLRWASAGLDFLLPDWAKAIPDMMSKLQRELSMASGSLADEIWQEAHDPYINSEIRKAASVRVSTELCPEEQEFLRNRRAVTTRALARYLDIPREDIHPDDVPCIAIIGSGGGLRALVAGTGSLLASKEDGLFDCATYTAGVSGSCWLQAIYNSSLGSHNFEKVVAHLKARIGIHIAYPPVALAAMTSAPTNKFLLSGFVEKLRGDPNSDFGIVDIYGLLLAARLLVPKGELGVNDNDLKISNQRAYLARGEHPMPIYTAVRHEIPIDEKASPEEKATGSPSETTKEKAKQEAWFQWFEITPYELFCEEFSAGIPTWSIGRQFENGEDMPSDDPTFHVPELRLPLLLGVFGSAFCATLAHYYKEIRPLVQGLMGFRTIDGVLEERNEDLSRLHPIEPASIPNFCYKMDGRLPSTTPEALLRNKHLQLMDAGMSNNLPIYPLLRPGRGVDILITFDASADVKTDNWLSIADGYAKQRGIKGWPIGAGWPKSSDTADKTAGQLDAAQASSAVDADRKVQEAKQEQQNENGSAPPTKSGDSNTSGNNEPPEDKDADKPNDLGYCTVWVGTTQERQHTDIEAQAPAAKEKIEDWELMEPDAGIAVVYFPFLANPKVSGVDPVTSPYMSTWNFIYTPGEIDKVIELARANFAEGKDRTRRTVLAVYERKRRIRLDREAQEERDDWRRRIRSGIVGDENDGEGNHFK